MAFTPLGAVYGSAIGTGVATLIDGGNFKDALKSGLKAGAMGALTVGIAGNKGSFSKNIKGELGNFGDRFSQTYEGLTKGKIGFKYEAPKDPKDVKIKPTSVDSSASNFSSNEAKLTPSQDIDFASLENPAFKDMGSDLSAMGDRISKNHIGFDSGSSVGSDFEAMGDRINKISPSPTKIQDVGSTPSKDSLSGFAKVKDKVSNILTNDAVKIGGGLALLKAAAKPAEMELPSIGDFTPEGKPRSGSDELRENPDKYLIRDLGQSYLQDGEYVRKPIFGGRIFNPLVDPSSTNYIPQVTQTELQATDPPIDKTSLMVASQQPPVNPQQQQQALLTPEQQLLMELTQGPDRRGVLGMLQRGARNQYPQPPVMATHGGQIFPRRNGGIMPYEGVPNEDSVRAMLMPGEFVMTKEAVRGIGRGDVGQGIKNMYSVMRSLEARDRRG